MKKILLIGDFSSVHSELKKSLEKKGHQVTLISGGDGFKNFQRDVDIRKEAPETKIQKFLSLLGELIGLRGILYYFSIRDRILKLDLPSFDYIQVINVLAIQRCGSIANLLFWRELRKSGAKIFLCALGTDYAYVRASLRKKLKYSYFYSFNFRNFKFFIPQLRFYYFPFYGILFRYAVNSSRKVIPGAYDYLIAYNGIDNLAPIIPFPINENLIKNPIQSVPDRIIIFYGKQTGRELLKGYQAFDRLISLIQKKYPGKFELIVTESLPYDEYLKVFSNCHIFLDQTNGNDRGINALTGMAAGKIVLSGAEKDSFKHYDTKGIESKPLLNASPDEYDMLRQIEEVIEDPEMIPRISKAAIAYIRQNHISTNVAEKYLSLWENS